MNRRTRIICAQRQPANILCGVNKALKNTNGSSLRPETFVPAFPRQSNHPVLCNNAKEPHWYNQQYVSHTQTHTHTPRVIFRKLCLSKTTGGEISHGREDGSVSWMMLRWWHKDTHICSLFMVRTILKTTNNQIRWQLRHVYCTEAFILLLVCSEEWQEVSVCVS